MENQIINNNTIIKNISYDQTEILYNIMKLYNDGKPFECDITASELKFYQKNKLNKYDIPVPKILMDVFPQSKDIIKITPFQKLPLEDNSIQSIVVDLPFVISPRDCKSKTTDIKEGSNLISNRFSSFYPADELFENIYWWINECYRVVKEDGIVVWKFQSTVSGGRECWGVPFSFMVAEKAGFYVEDEFILEAKARIVADSHFKNGQKHARKYTSTFWVFRKNDKLAKKNSCLRWLELCEMQNLEGKVWENNKQNKELNEELDKKFNVVNTRKKRTTVKKEKNETLSYFERMRQKVLENNDEKNKIKTTIETNFVENSTNNEIVNKNIKNRKSKKKYVIEQLTKTNELINVWNSYDEIVKTFGISKASLSQCVNGKIKTSGGFKWFKKTIV